jgi:hypothetical protein
LSAAARFLLFVSLLGASLLSTFEARAQRVVLVQTGAQDPMLVDAWHRLVAELRIHHFESETVELGDGADLAQALAETARARGAIAAVALVRQNEKTAVDVWLIDRVSGKTTLRRIVVRPGADASSVLAIRAVDLLRASFREFGTGERPPADVADVDRGPVPEAVRDLSSEPRPVFTLAAGAMMLVGFPAFGAAFGPSLGAFANATDRLSIGVVIAGPLVGAKFSAASGEASMTQALGVVDARLSIFRSRWFEAGPSLSFGAYHLSAAGIARPPLISKEDRTWAAIGGGGGFFQARLGGNVAAGLSARVFGTLPQVGVSVADDVALLRFPIVETSLGIVVGL